MKYEVLVYRCVRLRAYSEWTLGPYRFRWVARVAAWLQRIDGDNVTQIGIVRPVGGRS